MNLFTNRKFTYSTGSAGIAPVAVSCHDSRARHKPLPQRVADSTEITFEDNGILLLRRNMELLQIEKQPVQVAVRAILRRLQLLYFPKIFPLRGWYIRALSAPGSGGTIEEGIFFAVL